MILLPIHAEFVEKIKDGSKRFEFRKRIPSKLHKGDFVAIYCTRPICNIVGCFEVGGVLSGSPCEVWAQAFRYAGIDKCNYDAYFSGHLTAYALCIRQTYWLREPISLFRLRNSEWAPQSFLYLTPEQAETIVSMMGLMPREGDV